jgi:hypothetical protein
MLPSYSDRMTRPNAIEYSGASLERDPRFTEHWEANFHSFQCLPPFILESHFLSSLTFTRLNSCSPIKVMPANSPYRNSLEIFFILGSTFTSECMFHSPIYFVSDACASKFDSHQATVELAVRTTGLSLTRTSDGRTSRSKFYLQCDGRTSSSN